MARRRSGLFYIRFQEVISHVQERKRKQAFSGFLAFSIKKEISDRLKILFPFFVPAAAQYVFAAEKKKTTASQGLPTVRGLFQFVMTYVFLLFVSVIMGINKSPKRTSNLINGMTDIISHIFIPKFHPLGCLVSIGTGLFETASCGCDAQHPAAVCDDLALIV